MQAGSLHHNGVDLIFVVNRLLAGRANEDPKAVMGTKNEKLRTQNWFDLDRSAFIWSARRSLVNLAE